jgi:hypothetical protein
VQRLAPTPSSLRPPSPPPTKTPTTPKSSSPPSSRLGRHRHHRHHGRHAPTRDRSHVHATWATHCGVGMSRRGARCEARGVPARAQSTPKSGVCEPQSSVCEPKSGVCEPQISVCEPKSGFCEPKSGVPFSQTPLSQPQTSHLHLHSEALAPKAEHQKCKTNNGGLLFNGREVVIVLVIRNIHFPWMRVGSHSLAGLALPIEPALPAQHTPTTCDRRFPCTIRSIHTFSAHRHRSSQRRICCPGPWESSRTSQLREGGDRRRGGWRSERRRRRMGIGEEEEEDGDRRGGGGGSRRQQEESEEVEERGDGAGESV